MTKRSDDTSYPIEPDGLQQLGIGNSSGLGLRETIGNPRISPRLGTTGLRSALCCDVPKGLTEVGKQATHRFADVVGNDRAYRLEARFGLGCLDRVSAACADPEKPDPRLVDVG
ncbi:hypothetical protein ASG68_28475 [Rhizobium sp. Leaf453]|nr:hypothetical protein ASG50_16295 [Rhizobium sp. Leaf386]KQU02166.1 hypothetical protein ASG68_28475 [Rhizobium sp. Leaf453]